MGMVNESMAEKKLWINPIGGLGDTLMLSGVLKHVVESFPDRRFNLIRRTSYLSILKGHPAIAHVGFPPPDAAMIGTDYWAAEDLGGGEQRAFQILARIFGLSTPVEETLYLPPGGEERDLLHAMIPWTAHNIVIAPHSESPRKIMDHRRWEELTSGIKGPDRLIMQVGKRQERHIRGAYSLRGLTTPRQLISLLKRVNLVVTADNFVMHAAHLVGVPAVVLWGPTLPETFGYPEQKHLESPLQCAERTRCLGARYPDHYHEPCPMGDDNCLNGITLESICQALDEYYFKDGKRNKPSHVENLVKGQDTCAEGGMS
jgi:ADP-heptose:LPS heptosyltransferase